ncbi:hypothetical protein [Sedimentitalea todarodis]|uniref:Uncharacterized protein n=1 Tax=Sedimentitalea todarodis TaxID=1631240 RepID=A0ABU3VE75_9RHOB|nr:hypothetical protein [Sedimentitalea todarodis]MDU9004493.1 hypothetical protein [Sedimentitalea todarodis]
MADKSIPVADVPKIVDHQTFGRFVIEWALIAPEKRPTTVAKMREKYPRAFEAMEFPAHVGGDVRLNMVQGEINEIVVNLPPLHKLLPMLRYLEDNPESFANPGDFSFDINNPPQVPEVPGAEHYQIPRFFEEFIDDRRQNGDDAVDYKQFFLKQVADYSIRHCR